MMRRAGIFEFFGELIPGWWIVDLASPDHQRFLATQYGWDKLRLLKCREAQGRCQLRLTCLGVRTPFKMGELHHLSPHGRGMGGSWRDDRETIWTCPECHRQAENNSRQKMGWSGGKAS